MKVFAAGRDVILYREDPSEEVLGVIKEETRKIPTYGGSIEEILISRDGKVLVAITEIYVEGVPERSAILYDFTRKKPFDLYVEPFSMCLSHNGRFLAISDRSGIILYDLHTPSINISFPCGYFECMSISCDKGHCMGIDDGGTLLAISVEDGIRLINVDREEVVMRAPGDMACLSRDGSVLWTLDRTRKVAEKWSVSTKARLQVIETEADNIRLNMMGDTVLLISEDGLVVHGSDRTVKLENSSGAKCADFFANGLFVAAILGSPDGRYIYIWDTRNGRVVTRANTKVDEITISEPGKIVGMQYRNSNPVEIWRVIFGRLVRRFRMRGVPRIVKRGRVYVARDRNDALVICEDGRFLWTRRNLVTDRNIVVSRDGVFEILDMDFNQIFATEMPVHVDGPVVKAGNVIVFGSRVIPIDGTVAFPGVEPPDTVVHVAGDGALVARDRTILSLHGVLWNGGVVTLSPDGNHWAAGIGKYIVVDGVRAVEAGFTVKSIGWNPGGIVARGKRRIAVIPEKIAFAKRAIFTVSPDFFRWGGGQRVYTLDGETWLEVIRVLGCPFYPEWLVRRWERIICYHGDGFEVCLFPELIEESLEKSILVINRNLRFIYDHVENLERCKWIVSLTNVRKEYVPYVLYDSFIVANSEDLGNTLEQLRE